MPFGPASCRRISSASMPADHEEDQRGAAVEDPDLLVVDGGEPAPEAGRRLRAAQEQRPRGGAIGARGRSSSVSSSSSTSAPTGSRRSSSACCWVIVGMPGGVFSVNDGMPTQMPSTGWAAGSPATPSGSSTARSSTQLMRFCAVQLVVAAGERRAAREVREVRAVASASTSRRRCGSSCTGTS